MRVVVSLLLVGGCGRIGFAPSEDANTRDTPKSPALVCALHRVPAAPAVDVDIAVTSLAAGGYVVATAPTTPGKISFDLFDTLHGASGTAAIQSSQVTSVSAVFDTGTNLVAASRSDIGTDVFSIDYDLSNGMPLGGVTVAEPGRDCITTDADRTKAVLVTASGNQMYMAYVTATSVGINSSQMVGGTIVEHACVDGTDHAHVGWRLDTGACGFAQILVNGSMPQFGASQALGRCSSLRGDLGMQALDDGMSVYVDPTGAVVGEYIFMAPTPAVVIAAAGRAPRVKFDGTRFWVAWIDTTTGADVLHAGTLSTSGNLVAAPLPMLPAGDEAFELVRVGSNVELVVRETEAASFLELCP